MRTWIPVFQKDKTSQNSYMLFLDESPGKTSRINISRAYIIYRKALEKGGEKMHKRGKKQGVHGIIKITWPEFIQFI